MTPAETGSIEATKTRTATGHDRGEHELRQIAGEGGLERVDPADRDRRNLGAPGVVERGRPVAEPPLDELETQLREHRRRSAPAGDLEAPCGRGPRRRCDDQEDERQGEARERGAAERAGGDVGQQSRLHQHEQRGDDAERGVGAEQDAHGARAGQQTRVQAAHGLPAGLPRHQLDRVARLLPAEPSAENVIRPGLVEQHDRQENRPRRPSSR